MREAASRPVINPNATAASITSWLNKWRKPSVPSTDKRRLEFITIKADATLFDFDKSNGSFAGKTTVDQLRAIQEKIVALLKGGRHPRPHGFEALGHREGTRKEKAGSDGRRFEKEDSEIEAEMLTGRVILETAGL